MTRVVILGGGVSGLSTAIRLREAGHDATVVARDYLVGTSSWVATAIWHLFWVEVDDRVERWAATTLQELLDLADDPRAGITIIRGIECVRAGTPEDAEFRSGTTAALWKKVVPSYDPLTRDELISRLPPGYPSDTLVGGYEIAVPIADMSVYLPYLMNRLRTMDVQLQTDSVRSLAELTEKYPCDVVVNCTGLGARELTGDRELHGVKGQIVRVHGVKIDSYIADDFSPTGMTYVLPRMNDVVLGGTQDFGVEDSEVDQDVSKKIISRCTELVPALTDATVEEHMAGVRPYRTSIRLEIERFDHGTVIHNYGHGGSGVSLSWGCASEVVELVRLHVDALT